MDTEYRKSSRSVGNGACVEVKAVPFKSSHSMVQVRDSKHPDGIVLRFDKVSWGKFITSVK